MSHFLYAIVADGCPAIKIGHAAHPERRLAEHQTGCPMQLTILRIWRFYNRTRAIEVETACHRQFIARRVRGEWHEVEWRDVDAAVEEYCSVRGIPYSSGDLVSKPGKPTYATPRQLPSKWWRAHEVARAVLLEDTQ